MKYNKREGRKKKNVIINDIELVEHEPDQNIRERA
jgi:hypothetical protein